MLIRPALRASGGPSPRGPVWSWLRAGYVPEHVLLAAIPSLAGSAVAGTGSARNVVVALTAVAAACNEVGGRYVNYLQDDLSGVDGAVAHLPPNHPARSGRPSLVAMYRVGVGMLGGFAALGAWISWQVHPWLAPLGPVLAWATIAYAGGSVRFGHRGLAEAGRFLASGLMATGSAVAVSHQLRSSFVVVGVAFGALAVAGMTVQNIRDAGPDAAAGKSTVPSRSGPVAGRGLLAGAVVTALGAGEALAPLSHVPWMAVTGLAPLAVLVFPAMGGRARWGFYAHPVLTTVVYGVFAAPLLAILR